MGIYRFELIICNIFIKSCKENIAFRMYNIFIKT